MTYASATPPVPPVRVLHPPLIPHPPRWRHPRPSDWGIGMTVCIAVIADNGETIVTASDRMVSRDDTSAELLLKARWVHRQWATLFAGEDITQFRPIVQEVATVLESHSAVSLALAEQTFTEKYRERLKRECEARVLSVYGLDRDTFVKNGLRTFGEAAFSDLRYRLETTRLGADFLVYGFDTGGNPHLFTVVHPGVASHYTDIGCWAIGSGAQTATSSLFFHRYFIRHSCRSAIYEVCAAKFMAESAMGVGKDTAVIALRRDGSTAFLNISDVQAIRSLWEREGQPRLPTISDDLFTMEWQRDDPTAS